MSLKTLHVAAMLVGAILFVGGCGSQKGTTVFSARRDTNTVVGTALKSGTYRLYTSLNGNPVMTIHLNEGDKLGFQKAADGRIEAVYQDKTYDLNKDTLEAYWKVED